MERAGRWRVELYRDTRGNQPVLDFILSLQAPIQSKVARNIDLLEESGPWLSMPLASPLAGYDFWELRSQVGRISSRIFYCVLPGRRIVLLHGFLKKSQKTPDRELRIAETRHRELQSRRQA